jgi:tetratricopeptide (TPR) repeat protein
MKNFRRINNLTGWITFLIASFVYLSTIEETGSFWDCGEFIAAAYKLQVGHPPGASLFLLIARFFTFFAGDNVKLVPVMVNIMSALSSGVTILFLFWTITHMARKIFASSAEALTNGQTLMVIGSGLVGALAYTFSDSFWFSASEGEVYAMSSMFTAIVFWAMLKWEEVADERHSDRWLILIAYLMGLSIGVHLLNLLCIPALAFIYYFRRHKGKVDRNGIIKTALVGVAILATIQYGIIAGFVKIGAYFDLFFVNTFGMPFWSGFIFFILAIAVATVFGLRYTIRTNKTGWNTILLSFSFILIGYLSYAQIVIRSQANPPMDENNPETAFSLLSYINREQYGDRPLMYGQYFNAKVVDQEEGSPTYSAIDGKYVQTGAKIIPIYDPNASTILPRMYSNQDNHVTAYKEWAGIKSDRTPTFGENLGFLFSYQMGHMFWRYFMWNFAGRQNDIQGHGGIQNGNWMSGIKGIDAIRLGPQDKLPESATWNKGMNHFYFLPLLLGLAGLLFHFKSHRFDASVVMLLFFFTGIAIVLYLNQTPYQPRERDYAYAGAFYAFAIWIGLGVIAIAEPLSKKVSPPIAALLTTVLCLIAVPGIMAKEGWDDHDRSHRYTSRDFAYNYLNSCAPNAIIFTNGDNDTFPLWYIQEVEGVRTDVRVCNLSLLNTDWYIEQMKRKTYESDPVPFSLTLDKIVQGTRDYVPFYDRNLPGYSDLKDVIRFVGSDEPGAKARTRDGSDMNYFPTKKFSIPVNKDKVLKNGTVSAKDASLIADKVEFEIDRNFIMKADLMILDLISNFEWERPVYFAITVGSNSYLELEEHFQLEGLAYRFVPIKNPPNPDGQIGRVNTDIMYDNLMNKFKWGNMNDPRVYLDQNNLNMTTNLRNNFSRLAEALLVEGKRDSAINVLDRCLEVMPDNTVPYNLMMLRIVELYYTSATLSELELTEQGLPVTADAELADKEASRAIESANAIVRRLSEIYQNDAEYYLSLKGTSYYKFIERDLNQSIAIIRELGRMADYADQTELAAELDKTFKDIEKQFY